jgi:hypothetical protein
MTRLSILISCCLFPEGIFFFFGFYLRLDAPFISYSYIDIYFGFVLGMLGEGGVVSFTYCISYECCSS